MNSLLIAAAAAWLVSQSTKVLFGLVKYGRADKSRIIWRVIWAGGMPSTHTALAVSTTMATLLTSGAQSLLFGLSLVVSCIVIYDRSRMYAIYTAFQDKYPALKETVKKDPTLQALVGHSLPEILVGLVIGLVTGSMTFFYL
jgi:acid phosphatase family membrane protein YuiD